MVFNNIVFYREIKPSPNGKFKDCWYWTRSCNSQGYGHIGFKGKIYKVHRISMFLFKNFDLNSSFEICHDCDNPICFNPDHLFVGTHQDNMQDALEKSIIIRNNFGRFGGKESKSLLSTKDKILVYEMIDLKMSQKEIAESFGVSRTTIQKALKERAAV